MAHGWRVTDFFFGHLVKSLFTNRSVKMGAKCVKMGTGCSNLVKMHIFMFCWLLWGQCILNTIWLGSLCTNRDLKMGILAVQKTNWLYQGA